MSKKSKKKKTAAQQQVRELENLDVLNLLIKKMLTAPDVVMAHWLLVHMGLNTSTIEWASYGFSCRFYRGSITASVY